MSDMKCPKCGGKLVYWGATGALLKCSQCHFGWGNEELWQELIRTRKALDRAKLILKNLLPDLDGYERLDVEKSIAEITALEQKEEQ